MAAVAAVERSPTLVVRSRVAEGPRGSLWPSRRGLAATMSLTTSSPLSVSVSVDTAEFAGQLQFRNYFRSIVGETADSTNRFLRTNHCT